MRRLLMSVMLLVAAACSRDKSSTSAPASNTAGEPARHYGLGRTATSAEVAALDVDVGPDGEGLPPGSGSAQQGQLLYKLKCAMCHGPAGQGMAPVFPALIGRDPKGEGFAFATDFKLTRTIGNYWPHATTVFDYVRRAMPLLQPGSLTSDEVYALTAYLLAANNVMPMTATLDAASLKQVKMPYADKFVTDNRRGGNEVK